jgi:dipeptidase E
MRLTKTAKAVHRKRGRAPFRQEEDGATLRSVRQGVSSWTAADRANPIQRAKPMRRILLLSTSTVHGGGFLEYAEAEIRTFLGGCRSVLFVPYARPSGMTHDEYTGRARKRFEEMGLGLNGLHESPDPPEAVRRAGAVFVGGGNTFVLLRELYAAGVLPVLREQALGGMPYLPGPGP